MTRTRWFSYTIVILLALAGIGGYWLLTRRFSADHNPPPITLPSPTPTTTPAPSPTAAPLPLPTVSPVAASRPDGNQYADETFGYSLWYPKDWRTEICGDGCQSFGPKDQPEETGVEVTVIAAPLATAKTRLPIFTNAYNRQKSEEPVTIGSTIWTKLIIEQQASGLIFTKHLIERGGKTFMFSLGGESPTTTAIYLQMLESFAFTTR